MEKFAAEAVPSTTGFELLLEWLSSRVAEPVSLSEMEARSGYSRRTLQRAFQLRFGCGPMQWLLLRRLELPLEQLSRASASDSVAAIASRCGYLSLSSFSRDFSLVYGRRPSEILRASQPASRDRAADQGQAKIATGITGEHIKNDGSWRRWQESCRQG